MFTGIIQSLGKVKNIQNNNSYATIEIFANDNNFLDNAKVGDSISVNGVCLTAKGISNNIFQADAMHETLNKSNLSFIKQNDLVNLEKASTPSTFMGGHIVQGHVDGVGEVSLIKKLTNQWIINLKTDETIISKLFPKASISLNGISLTVLDVQKDIFSVSIIPFSFQHTNIAYFKKGSKVNIETDIIGKYVYKYLEKINDKNKITKGFMSQHGF
jgi:riboflavin synthase